MLIHKPISCIFHAKFLLVISHGKHLKIKEQDIFIVDVLMISEHVLRNFARYMPKVSVLFSGTLKPCIIHLGPGFVAQSVARLTANPGAGGGVGVGVRSNPKSAS